jgi:hypothetical protein
MDDDPLRLFLVLRRGAIATLARAAELAGAAAVACVATFAEDPEYGPALAAWGPRPGKVCLRARTAGQWTEVLELPHALAGEPGGEAVAALPPRRRSERGRLLERLQAMSTDLGEAPAAVAGGEQEALTYVLNPRLEMSSGKVLAQVAHAAVMAAAALPEWAAAGCPGRLVAPGAAAWRGLERSDGLAARVVDAGLTEVAAAR